MRFLCFVSLLSFVAKRSVFILFLTLLGQGVWASKPNIIFILADDLGYGDVQSLNSNSKLPTPNLNLLASQGMTFLDAHSPSAV